MAFVPFTKDEQPTMAAFNEKFEQAIQQAIQQAFADGVKIEVGSYVGTGTYGASNPTTITVGFVPKMLFVGAAGRNSGTILFCEAYSSAFKNAACLTFNVDFVQTNDVYASKTGNTVKWYATERSQSSYLDTDIQSNRSGMTYHYIAIG